MAVLPVQGFGPRSRTAVQGPAGTPGSSAEGAERHQVGPCPSCFSVTSAPAAALTRPMQTTAFLMRKKQKAA